jgi:hypothetical protein
MNVHLENFRGQLVMNTTETQANFERNRNTKPILNTTERHRPILNAFLPF